MAREDCAGVSGRRVWESWETLDAEEAGGENGEMSESQAHGGAHLPRVVPLLELMTREELVELNRIVVQRLRLMQEIEAHGQMMNLRVGQKVRFAATDGRLIRGTIVRHNRKSVTLVAEDGHTWRVSPAFLQADQEATE